MKKSFHTTKTLRLTALLGIVAAALALSGCSLTGRPSTPASGVSQDELSAGGEPYFNVGNVTYQVQESRQLNPYGTSDSQYFAGVKLPGGKNAQQLAGSKFWFGVFLWAKNQNKQTLPTSSKFEVTDSQGDVFKPTALKPSINPYAWTSQKLGHNDIEPNSDSTAAAGPTDGGLVLFQIPQSAYQNRPLTLEIYAPGSTSPSKVSLDL